MGVIIKRTDIDIPVAVQDQTTRPIFYPMCSFETEAYDLASNTVAGEYTITLDDATGLVATDCIIMQQDSTYPAIYTGKIMSIVDDVLTMDTPVDKIFNAEIAELYKIECDLSVDGSTTVKEFKFVNQCEIPIDITKIMVHITDETAMDDGKFGGISALTNGCVLRVKRNDGSYQNLFNIKTNGKLGEYFACKQYDEKAPTGVYGICSEISIAGQENIGVAIRLYQNEYIEWLVQDDLTDLTSFSSMAKGHYTDEV